MPAARDFAAATDPARNQQFRRFALPSDLSLCVAYGRALITVEGKARGEIRMRDGGRLRPATEQEAAGIRAAVLSERSRVIRAIGATFDGWLSEGGQ